MVSWAPNTVHTFASSATPAGTPAASTSAFSFGTTPATPAPAGAAAPTGAPPSTPLFGASPSPATPASGGLLGSNPAPAPAFGSPAPAFGIAAPAFGSPAAPAFGAPAAPAPATGLFGAPAAPAPAFGFGAPQYQQQQQIPAQAAMQAHMDASARQEQARLVSVMEKIHGAYTGAPPKDGSDKAPFVSIVYNDVTPQQLQLQSMHPGPNIVPPPRPPEVLEKEWTDAVASNPDPGLYMPAALGGADNLRARIAWQQDRATELSKGVAQLRTAHDTVQGQCQRFHMDLQHLARTHAALRKRLLDVMRKVEVVRCMNLPLQEDEVKAKQRLVALLRLIDKVATVLAKIIDQTRTQPRLSTSGQVAMPDRKQLLQVLNEQREGIQSLTDTLQPDLREMGLLKQHVVPQVHAPPQM